MAADMERPVATGWEELATVSRVRSRTPKASTADLLWRARSLVRQSSQSPGQERKRNCPEDQNSSQVNPRGERQPDAAGSESKSKESQHQNRAEEQAQDRLGGEVCQRGHWRGAFELQPTIAAFCRHADSKAEHGGADHAKRTVAGQKIGRRGH